MYKDIIAYSNILFQYGSTLMESIYYNLIQLIIYIPIWFYFNEDTFDTYLDKRVIYIPIWFYFNLKK